MRVSVGPRRTLVWGTPEERFWAKVDKDGDCWEWMAWRSRQGYGQFTMDRGGTRWQTVPAHRVAWELTNGSIPDRLLVLHRCDNPPCCRPDHLFLGTHKDNAVDREGKSRGRQCPPELHARGEAVGIAKLTEEAVREIRARYAAGGLTQQVLADEYGVHQGQISNIIRRRTWRHV